MVTESKNKEKEMEEINELRKRFGKAPVGSQKSYEQRLKEYNERKENKK